MTYLTVVGAGLLLLGSVLVIREIILADAEPTAPRDVPARHLPRPHIEATERRAA